MHYRSFIRFSAALGALALTTAACGGGGGVGGGLKDVKGGSKNGAIGQATTTVAPVTTAAPVATTVKKAPPTTAAVAATPEATYIIQSDTKGQYIEPLSHTVRVGALVRFTNQDSIPHVIDGRINDKAVLGPSPSIAPGANWDVRPTVAGTYDIVDEQRTYAQGVTLTVSR